MTLSVQDPHKIDECISSTLIYLALENSMNFVLSALRTSFRLERDSQTALTAVEGPQLPAV